MHNYFINVPEIKNINEEGVLEYAFDKGLGIFKAAGIQAYRKVNKKTLFKFADACLEKLNDEGLLQLVDDERRNIPTDCYIDIAYKPSYGLLALCIYLAVKYQETFFNGIRESRVAKLIKGVLGRGLMDHGYEAELGYLENILTLCMAGLKDFTNLYFDIYTEELLALKQMIESISKSLAEANNNNRDVRILGVGDESATIKFRQIIAAFDGFTESIFVYGTLMDGQCAHDKIRNSSFGGYGELKGYSCYDLGAFPAIVPCENSTTFGEIYFVKPDSIADMDRYESEGMLYTRKNVEIVSVHGKVNCWAYIYNHQPDGKPINGRWHLDDLVWYACYGSNMSSKRFRCYIEGGVCEENKKSYEGCRNKNLWKDNYWEKYDGKVYFSRFSGTWQCGVAFYDPHRSGETIMRLYLVTKDQLHDIQLQECGKNALDYKGEIGPTWWYGNRVYLGIGFDGRPVYTVTSAVITPPSVPSKEYVGLIKGALNNEGGLSEIAAEEYLNSCQ